MKKLLTLILIGLAGIASANNGKYEQVMLRNITALHEAKTIEDYQKVINTLDRIGMAEDDKWEPHYYGAYGNILMSMRVSELSEKDQYLDAAQSRLDKATAIQENHVEVVALQGFIHMMRLSADPANRGQKYAGLAFGAFNKAVEMDAENPRALIMRAQMKQGTAKFFGTSTDEACGEAQKALELYDQATKGEASISPSWGRGQAASMVEQCGAVKKDTN